MSATPPPAPGDDGAGNDGSREAVVAKTAAVLVFSGIALSLVKSFTARFPSKPQPIHTATPQPPRMAEIAMHPSWRTVRIEKGDTLWGLSRRYGVSVGAIKEANSLTGNTIYAGRNLVIPSS